MANSKQLIDRWVDEYEAQTVELYLKAGIYQLNANGVLLTEGLTPFSVICAAETKALRSARPKLVALLRYIKSEDERFTYVIHEHPPH